MVAYAKRLEGSIVDLMTERDQLRKQIAQGGFRQRAEHPARAPIVADEDTSGGTINQLIANADWAEKKKPDSGSGHANAQVPKQEASHEEMLAPDLVFTTKDEEEDDDAR